MAATVTVLGTSGAWPEPGRACSGFLVEHAGYRVVLDLGYGTAGRLLAALESPSAAGLDAIVITHRHPDHMVDLHAVFRARWFGARGRPRIPVFAGAGVRETLGALEDDAAAVREVFDWHSVPGSHVLGPFRLTGTPLPHFVPNVGVRLDGAGVSLAYSGDCGPSPALVDLARDVDLFICEASDRHQQPDVPRSPQGGLHLDAAHAGMVAARAGARRLLLSHFWPGNDRKRSRASAAAEFRGQVDVAEEGMRLVLGDEPRRESRMANPQPKVAQPLGTS